MRHHRRRREHNERVRSSDPAQEGQTEHAADPCRGMIADFRLWGSRRWSRTNAPPKKPQWRTWVARDFNHPNAFLSEGSPCRCGRKLPRNAASPPSLSLLAPSRPPSWEREKGAAGVMGGQRGVPPGRGFEGAGAPRQPQCITLGRLAPRHYAVRRRPRCPASPGAPPRRARGNARGAASLRFVASDAGNRCCPASDGAFRESLQPQRRGLRPLREALWLSIVCTIQVSNPVSVEYSPIRRHLLDPLLGPRRRKLSINPARAETVMAFDGGSIISASLSPCGTAPQHLGF